MEELSWHERIYEVIKQLGGEATLKDIYEAVEKSDVLLTSAYQNTIRDSIQRNSSDSARYNGKRDWFYSVNGKGEGIWGIRKDVPDVGVGNFTEDDISFPEGKEQLKRHISRERNPRLIREAKKRFKKIHGRLYCEVCGFDFKVVYGEIGEDFIEAHHTKAISEMKEGDKTSMLDLAMVCSNCHRMLHKSRPWKNKEELKAIIKEE